MLKEFAAQNKSVGARARVVARRDEAERTVFKNPWLPYLLVLPQMAVTVVFFFWPAFKSLQLSVFRVSPFGDRKTFVGLDNFAKLLADPSTYASV